MRFKRFSAMLLALAMCMGVFSTTVFAYSDESATTTTTGKAETVETVPEKTEDKTSEEVPYTVTVNEDGTVVFSFNGKEWTYGAEESEDNNMGTGKVVTSGSRLNVSTGAGMNYEIIDQLRPGEEVVVVGVEGDWYQITVPEKNGYVHSDYLELIEKAEQNSEMDMALLMMFMSAFMQNTDTSEPALTPDGTLIVLACGGGFFVFKKVQEKKKEQEAAKPDPDADYVDDDEDYGYDPEFEDDDADSSVDEDDNEPV